jgi:drug/metabolite transporter (DMT)-like permease
MLALALGLKGVQPVMAARHHWRGGALGGMMSLGAYWIVIWAMTKAPIALVAALRETSILFAAMISVGFLGEPLSMSRGAAAALILAGVLLIKLA